MSDIDSDILNAVFSRLPADSLWRLRNVCKAWRHIIDDPSFVRSRSINHLSNCTCLLIRDNKDKRLYSLSLETLNYAKNGGDETIEADPTKQLISRGVYSFPFPACHGLILISRFHCVIWNPLIGDYLELPIPDTNLLTTGFRYEFVGLLSVSLGYDHSTDDYKVVRIDKLRFNQKFVLKTLVYSLKLGFWKRVDKDIPFDICGGKGVFLNGALYWRSRRNEIIMFDLGTEDYTSVQGPPLQLKPHFEHLEVMDRCLVFSCYVDNMRCLEGWILGNYGVETFWVKLFSIRPQIGYCLRPLAYLRKKGMILLQQEFENRLFLFDLGSDTLRNFRIKGLSCDVSCMQFFPGSFFRLNDGGGAAAAGVK